MKTQEGDDDILKQRRKQVSRILGDYQLKASMHGETAKFKIEDMVNLECFECNLTHDLLNGLPLLTFFDTPLEVFQFLITTSSLNINYEGVIEFQIQMPNKKTKKVELKTDKIQIDKMQFIIKTMQNMQAEIRQLKQKNKELEISTVDEVKNMLAEIKQLKQKNKELENSAVDEVKNMQAEMKQLKEKINEYENSSVEEVKKDVAAIISHFDIKFLIDNNNKHYHSFSVVANTVTKKEQGGTQYRNIFGKQITANSVYTYRVKLINTQNSDMFFGVGSNKVRGKEDSHNSGNFIGYSANDGTLQAKGDENQDLENQNRGVSPDQIIEVTINLINWKINWRVEDEDEEVEDVGEADIPSNLRKTPLFPVIYMRDEADEIEFV